MSNIIKVIINGIVFDFPRTSVNKYLIGNEAFTDAYSYVFPQDRAEDMNNNLRFLMQISDNWNNVSIPLIPGINQEDSGELPQKLVVNGIADFLEFIDKMFRLDQHAYNLISHLSDDFMKITELYRCAHLHTAPRIDSWFTAEFDETYRSLYTDEDLKEIRYHSFDFKSIDENKLPICRSVPFWNLLKISKMPERLQEGIFRTVDAMLSKGIEHMDPSELDKKDFTNNLFNFISYQFYVSLLPETAYDNLAEHLEESPRSVVD